MSERIRLLSSEPISREEVAELIVASGGTIDIGGLYQGVITAEKLSKHTPVIWVGVAYIDLLLPPQELAQVRYMLGSEPQGAIDIDISFAPGSQKLAIDFACMCAQRWPCVLNTFTGAIYSYEEMLERQKKGMVFDYEI